MACVAASLKTQATIGRHSVKAGITFSSSAAGAHHFKLRYTTVKVLMQTKKFSALRYCGWRDLQRVDIRSK